MNINWEAIGTAIAGIVGGALVMRRQLKADSQTIARGELRVETEKEEVSFIRGLREELHKTREELHAVSAQRNELAVKVGGLEAQVEHFKGTIDYLKRRVLALERARGGRVDTDYGELDKGV